MAINSSQLVINPKDMGKAKSLTALPTSEIKSFSNFLAKDLYFQKLLWLLSLSFTCIGKYVNISINK